MKVLLIGSFPKSLINFRRELIINIKNNKHNILTCAGELDKDTKLELDLLGVKYQSYKINRHSLGLISNLKSFYNILKIIKKFKPDIIISYTIKPVIYVCFISKILKLNNYPIITGLGYSFSSNKIFVRLFLRKFIIFLYKLALRTPKKIFFQNSDDIKYFMKNKIISKKNKVINTMGSGVNLKHFYYSDIKNNNFTFLMISRLLPEKGIEEYLKAAKNLKSLNSNLHFMLLGDYETNHPKNTFISDLIAESNVEYISYQKDVRPFILKASVIVLPSYREGMPRTILEGMAMGRAIITTDVPGCRDTVINDYNGYLIHHKDIKQLEEAMLKICDYNTLKKMGRNSRNIVEKKFDVNIVNELIINEIGL